MASFYTILSILLLCSMIFCTDQNQYIITTSNVLTDPGALVSSNGLFRLGFFSLSNVNSRYLGIWYSHQDGNNDLEVVWVANRDNPLDDTSGVLKISQDGNIQLLDAHEKIFWSTDVNFGSNNSSTALLQDTGNLLLLGNVSDSSNNVLWQSFDNPTESWLPEIKITNKNQLASWKSNSDPSKGSFTFGIKPQTQFAEIFVWDGNHPYWRSGPWNGTVFIGIPLTSSDPLALERFKLVENGSEKTVSFFILDQSTLTHFVLNYDGNFVQKNFNLDRKKWEIMWFSIGSNCDIYGYCGPFGSCNLINSPVCSCLKGFEPENKEEWSKGNWSSGCVRRTPLQCVSRRDKSDGFLKLSHMKMPADAVLLSSNDENDCGRQCLAKCECLGYVYYQGIGCMIWNNTFLDIQQFSVNGADLFIRLADAELGKTSKKKIILLVVIILGTISIIVLFFIWRWMNQRNADFKMSNPNTSPDIQDLPLFTFEKLVTATNNFHERNRLGRGGFGPVYKGILEDGQEIAVKRLATASGQGLQEFMNEVVVISKLQHMNLVKLLGCCVEGDEKMLVYEYMTNKSLNVDLFDPLKKANLEWNKRFDIIEGICRGLLYLHRDSRLRIIHRDLKASNILLDKDLNPKISDFGMARIFGRNEDQANTLRIVGTYGYMAPEYAMNGYFSEKSDVYSFGVLLLEIISGRSISSFYVDDSFGLLGYAWKLWNEENINPLIDTTLSDPQFRMDILRCIQLALLCIQELPDDRPTVSTIISMLHGEIATLPRPKQPGFIQWRCLKVNEFHQCDQHCYTINNVSLTSIGAR